MDTSVETRRGIVRTVITNQLLSAVFSFLMVTIVFKWLYNSDKGIVILFTGMAIFYFSGIYSYVYDQPKLDLIVKKRYDYLMPLKTGGLASFIIFLFTGVQFIINIFSPITAQLYGILAKLMNYPFFWFLYGRDGNCYNPMALIVILILPVLVSYLAYFMGIKGYSLAKVYGKVVYKK